MSIASTFLSLSITVAFPLALIAAIFHKIKLKPANGALVFFNIIAFGLTIATFINSIVGLVDSTPAYSYYNSYWREWEYVPESISECSYVALGLGLGAIVLGLIVMLSTFGCIRSRRAARLAKEETNEELKPITRQNSGEPSNKSASSVSSSPNELKKNLDYIDEIKRLKELLDCDAITKEEYDAKKKEILSK